MFDFSFLKKSIAVLAIFLSIATCHSAEEKELASLFKQEVEGIDTIYVNGDGEVIWYQNINGVGSHLFFLQKDMNTIIDVTESINNSLLEMGYNPISWKVIGECTPWQCKYALDYQIHLAYSCHPVSTFEKSNMVLVTFSHEGCKMPRMLKKLGIWDEKRGFRVLSIPGIEDVHNVTFQGDRLFVSGMKSTGSKKTISIVAIEDIWE